MDLVLVEPVFSSMHDWKTSRPQCYRHRQPRCMLDTLSDQEVDTIHIFLFKRTAPTQIEVYKKSRFFQEVNALACAGEKNGLRS